MQRHKSIIAFIIALCYIGILNANNIVDTDKTEQISDKSNYNNHLFINNIRALINNGDLDSTLYFINKSDFNNDIIKNIMRAELFEAASQFNTAALCYKKAYEEMNCKTDSLAWSTLLNIIITNHKSSNYSANKELLIEANRIVTESCNEAYRAELMNIESIIYNKLGIIDKAHSYIDSAIVINNKLNRQNDLSINYTTKANIYYRNRDYNSALSFFKKAYNTGVENKTTNRVIKNRTNIAVALHMKGMINSSIAIYRDILSDTVFSKTNPSIKGAIYNNISGLYYEVGKKDSFLLYLDSAIYISVGIRDFNLLKSAYDQKARFFYFNKNYKKAYKYSRIVNMYNDSLNTEQLISSMSGVELNNNFLISQHTEREAEISNQKRKHLITIFIIIVAIIAVSAIIIILTILHRQSRLSFAFLKSVNSLKKKHSDYLNVFSEIKRIKEINISLKKDMSRAVFILQENIEFYGKIDKIMSKETNISDNVKSIGSSVKNMQAMMKESDFIRGNAQNEDVDLRIRIKQEFPELTKNEIRLCILIRLELSTKEIVYYTNTTAGSVEVAKYRLRKKLGFDTLGEMQKKLITI